MITGFIGQRNSGKTLTMTIEAYKKYRQGYTIYSNYHLNFPYTPYDIDDLLVYAEEGRYFGNAIFLIDELHIYFDSRTSGQKRNRIFSYFLNQSSKNDIDIMYTSQYARQVEIRLRLNTEVVVESSCVSLVWEKGQSKPVTKYNYRPKPTDKKTITWVQNRMIKFNDTGKDKIIRRVFKANKYFALYNTREVVKMQTDMFQRAKEEKKITKKQLAEIRADEEYEATRTLKEKRAEQHRNMLFHRANERKLMGVKS